MHVELPPFSSPPALARSQMGLRAPQTPEERQTYCRQVLERHRAITSREGGNILILDIENYRKNERAFSQIGWIEIRYRKQASGKVEVSVDSIKHYVVIEHRPKSVRQSPIVPVQERSLETICRELKWRFSNLAASGLRTLLLAHAADNDLKCLENVFDMPMSLFRSVEPEEEGEWPSNPPMFEALDTQTLFANVLGINKSVRLCLAIWTLRIPTLGKSLSGGNFHCAPADCHYTFALYLRLIETMAHEFGR